jgi:hypothetical protein
MDQSNCPVLIGRQQNFTKSHDDAKFFNKNKVYPSDTFNILCVCIFVPNTGELPDAK